MQVAFRRRVIADAGIPAINFARASGSLVWDRSDRQYLDFAPGCGSAILGHCPPELVEALQTRAAQPFRFPGAAALAEQTSWAEMLVQRSFESQAYFCHSGAEANEAAIVATRRHQGPGRYKIVTFQGSFHGRTCGALAASGQPERHAGLGPMLAGFTYVPVGDLNAVANRIDSATAAIMIEPVQVDSGLRIAGAAFLAELRRLADQHDLLLIFDEVQTGCGRTGHWFSHQFFGTAPDILTLGESSIGAVAGGVTLIKPEVARSLEPKLHAEMFGGNPLAPAAGIALLESIEQEGLLEKAAANADTFEQQLNDLCQRCDRVREVRQAGLMIGIELEFDGRSVVDKCLEKGLLIRATQDKVLQLLPAINIDRELIVSGMQILIEAILETSQQADHVREEI